VSITNTKASPSIFIDTAAITATAVAIIIIVVNSATAVMVDRYDWVLVAGIVVVGTVIIGATTVAHIGARNRWTTGHIAASQEPGPVVVGSIIEISATELYAVIRAFAIETRA
jgi:hypothetical protein